ncbi:MAG: 3-hydroxyacyl-CoA dehydrogenase NAD-binding domain-containing protein [Syntrophales bacterium]|jgi:3-hydroxyacyl-CoA dehydrogenase
MLKVKNVGVVGTGLIGASWAAYYASKDFKVTVFDKIRAAQESGLQRAMNYLDALAQYGLIEKSRAQKMKGNISSAGSLEQAVSDADYVQESASENFDIKIPLFSEMDAIAKPETVLASSSSSLPMTQVQKSAKRPGRCVVAHPFNPPHLVPLVEIVPGNQTTPQTVEDVRTFFNGLGKMPVVLKKETTGFIANRLAAALWREAVDLVLKGVASVQDVDRALFAGPGIRWAFMGQHLIYHLGGGEGGYDYFINHIGKAFGDIWKDMAAWNEISDDAKSKLVQGMDEVMSGKKLTDVAQWRDKKIVALLKTIYGEEPPIE